MGYSIVLYCTFQFLSILALLGADIQNKFSALQSVHVSSLLVSSGYLWVGTSNGAILLYRIPYLHGLPMTSGKPLLASDGHTDAVRVLVDVHTSLDLPSARFDQFVSDEKIRNIGSFRNSPRSQSKQGISAKVKTPSLDALNSQDEGKGGLNCSVKIDQSALPIVSDIIKRLERPKGFGLSPLLGGQRSRTSPTVKPKPKRKSTVPSQQATPVAATQQLSEGESNVSAGNSSYQHEIEQPTQTTPPPKATAPATHSVDEVHVSEPFQIKSVDVSDTPSAYETPVTGPMYDEVPKDDDDGLEATSDPDISLKRYEGENFISLGDGLYDNFRISTLSFNIPGRKDNLGENNGHVFVLSGGRGLVDFRNSQDLPSQILNPQTTDIAASSIAFQIPK